MAISSTDCRARVADGEPVWYLVPDGVVQYINKYHLYEVAQGDPPPMHPQKACAVMPAEPTKVFSPQGDS